jgi:hypothetical protein
MPSHTFNDSESQWSSGYLVTTPTSASTWYLHVKGYNGADIGNGTFDYAVSASQTQPQILSIGVTNGTVAITWSAANGSNYRVQYSPHLGTTNWTDLVPDVQASGSTASVTDNTGGAGQRFYRVLLLP